MPLGFPGGLPSDMALDWEAVENALRSWVVTASGFSEAQVYWAEQKGPQPATADFITLRLGDIIALGSVDAIAQNYDVTRDLGKEVEQQLQGVREFGLTVQVFTAAQVGNSAARAVLGKIRTALYLPSIREALTDSGASPYQIGAVQNVTALRGTQFESRAVLEARFYVNDPASEFCGWIASVDTSTGGDLV